jgi:hypothetical protein
MKLTLKRVEVKDLFAALCEMNGSYEFKIKHAIVKNKRLLKPAIEEMQDMAKLEDHEFGKFERGYRDLVAECGYKSGDNEFCVVAPTVMGVEKIARGMAKKFNEEYEKLLGKYEDTLDKRREDVKDIDKYFNEEIEVEVYKFPEINDGDKFWGELKQNVFEAIAPLCVIGDENRE